MKIVDQEKDPKAQAKRPWFQIHLSTAIILMFVCGGLLGLNFHQYEVIESHLLRQYTNVCYGWPCPVLMEYDNPSNHRALDIGNFATAFFCIDIVLWLMMLFPIVYCCEYWVRRGISWPSVGLALVLAIIIITANLSPTMNWTSRNGVFLMEFGWPLCAWPEIPSEYRGYPFLERPPLVAKCHPINLGVNVAIALGIINGSVMVVERLRGRAKRELQP